MKSKKNFSKLSSRQPMKSLDEYEDIASEDDESDGVLDNLSEESDESSEEEVLALNSDANSSDEEIDEENEMSEGASEEEDDENKISDSDLDQPNDDLPDSKAWGKKKRAFYHGDALNDKKDYLNEEDEEAAKMEEEEAKTTQKRWASELDNADLSLDLLADDIAKKKEERDVEEEKIVVNLSQMNQQEKLKLLKKESPLFLTLIEDYKRLMKFLQDDLQPVLKHLSPRQLKNSSAGKFLIIYSQTILNYCTNISFYIYLKSQRADTESHPVRKWISRYQEMLSKLEPTYEAKIKPQVHLILNGNFDFQKMCRKNEKSEKSNNVEMESNHKSVNGNVVANGVSELRSDDDMDFDDDEENEGKRPITYEIAKNKGLTPHRKKELRNPRVKHRMKYRKAKIRRKGQIREVRKELQKYSGEISGIKTSVVKSVKLRN